MNSTELEIGNIYFDRVLYNESDLGLFCVIPLYKIDVYTVTAIGIRVYKLQNTVESSIVYKDISTFKLDYIKFNEIKDQKFLDTFKDYFTKCYYHTFRLLSRLFSMYGEITAFNIEWNNCIKPLKILRKFSKENYYE